MPLNEREAGELAKIGRPSAASARRTKGRRRAWHPRRATSTDEPSLVEKVRRLRDGVPGRA
jgi:hypothetical protein